jgi:hypothetical protein
MKAKLIKVEDERGRFYVLESKENLPENYTLSKENCDEIFGVVDVEKLAEEEVFQEYYDWGGEVFSEDYLISKRLHFIEGFNKAMELNKDKLFTEDDVNLAFVLGKNNDESRINKLINSRLQPTEIEVEIVMEKFIEVSEGWRSTSKERPKLDSNGNLILIKL